MKNTSLIVLIAAIAFTAGVGLTYVTTQVAWVSDMANQPSIKPQERPLLPPEQSVPTDSMGSASDSAGSTKSEGGHQEMGHQGMSGGSGEQHDHSAGKHDHGTEGNPEGMGHQHGASGAGGHQHDGASATHDHGSKSTSPAEKKVSQPLPTDLMGSAGTGPGKTIQSQGGQGKSHNKGADRHEHGSQGAPQPPAKGSQHDHTAAPHSHAGGGGHDHGTSKASGQQRKTAPVHKHGAEGADRGREKPSHESGKTEPMKNPGSMGMDQHSHGAGAGDGHAHGAEKMQSQGQVTNPIKPTEASVKKGHQLFNIYCTVCHGTEGAGGMPMESKIPGIPKFTADMLRSVDDDHMFSMITSGHGPMPGYAEALTPEDRWHVTNYVRTLPKKLLEKQRPVSKGASR